MNKIALCLGLLLVLPIMLCTGCGGGDLDILMISPAASSLGLGATQQFTARMNGETYDYVTWQVAAGEGTISLSGLYTAPLSSGIYTVTATSYLDDTKTATAVVTVSEIGD
ncbi:MAG: hypothetical protein ACYDBB_24725 [Armatimonadota bacterium]